MEDQTNSNQGNENTSQNPANTGGQQQPQPQPQMQQLLPVPNATASLVLGIISIPTCSCYGIVGLVLGIIAIVLANKGKSTYEQNPNMYNPSSLGNLKAGKVCGIIGVCLSSLMFLYFIVVISFYGAALSSLPWDSIMNQGY